MKLTKLSIALKHIYQNLEYYNNLTVFTDED